MAQAQDRRRAGSMGRAQAASHRHREATPMKLATTLRGCARASIALLALVLAAASPAAAAPGATFGAETFTLENGMQVVVIPNHRAPVVHHSVWYRVGAADEPRGKSGIAHMLEHLMFKGTKQTPNGEFSKIIARNGGTDNAFTSEDYTGYYQNIAADRLELVMKLEADRMVNLAFTENDFLTEREVVLEERRSRIDNRAEALFAEQLKAAQYLSHPYGLPIIGWEHEIRGFTYDDVLHFYRTYYAPNNAILIVAGDVTAEKLRPLAERIYGVIPPHPVPERIRPAEPPQIAARRVTMKDKRVVNPEWMRSYLVPSYHDNDDDQAVAIDVLSNILGGGTARRLYQALVVDRQLATEAGAWYDGTAYDRSRLIVYARPRPGVALDEVGAAVDEVLARVRDADVNADELARAKFGMRANAIYARDSLSSLARIFGAALTAGLTVDDVESWPELVQSVTADQVRIAADAALVAPHSVTGLLMPQSEGAL
jgi:zinc protease